MISENKHKRTNFSRKRVERDKLIRAALTADPHTKTYISDTTCIRGHRDAPRYLVGHVCASCMPEKFAERRALSR
jgi:hypothetical protein